MKIYLKKIFDHDINKQISFTKEVLKDFFDCDLNSDGKSIKMIGKKSKEERNVTILLSTDPRLGGEIKALIQDEGGMKANDILLFINESGKFQLEVVGASDKRYEQFSYLLNTERHAIVNMDIDTEKQVIADEEQESETDKSYWILVSKQENNNGMGFIDTDTYTAPPNKLNLFQNAKAEDRFVGYVKDKGIVVEGKITKKKSATEIEYNKIISYTNPVDMEMLRNILDPSSYHMKMNLSGTAFKISKKEYENIISKLNGENPCDLGFERNRIVFGAPGTGKSFKLQGNVEDCQKNYDAQYERVTFHPDYTYSQFVGAYKPISVNGQIDYKFVPGPFLRVYVKALKNSKTIALKPFILLIEEINRARVAAVFGDVFQLLDRDGNGESTYSIQTSEDVRNYLAEELGTCAEDYSEIRLPNNMFIWATMNSADQGVFPMDTAFKRRWNFTYIGIDDAADEMSQKIKDKKYNLGKGVNARLVQWNDLRKAINDTLSSEPYNINEDKLLGPYFITNSILENDDDNEFIKVFKNKVLMYLFDDAIKQKRKSFFGNCKDEVCGVRYSDICKEFDTKGVFIFPEAVSKKFIEKPAHDEVLGANEE